MKSTPPVGLVAAGSVVTTARSINLPLLQRRLGPIKSPTLRVASRICNSLGSGYPVRHYEDFAPCRLILICVPDGDVPSTVAGLASATLDWKDKSVVLCDPVLEAQDLAPVPAPRKGSLHAVDHGRLLLEGCGAVESEVRNLLGARGPKLYVVPLGRKSLFLAAVTFLESFLQPLLRSADQTLMHAGLSAPDNASVLDLMVRRTARAYAKAGKRAVQTPHRLERQLAALRAENVDLAHLFEAFTSLVQPSRFATHG